MDRRRRRRRPGGLAVPSCRRSFVGWPRPAVPVAEEDGLELETDAVPLLDLVADTIGEPAHVGGAALLVVDDEVRVLLTHDGAADALPLQPRGVDEAARRIAGWIAEEAAGGRQAERLVG